MQPRERLRLFGIEIDRVDRRDAVNRILGWIRFGAARGRYVVTPNLDHLVLLRKNVKLQEAYRKADLVVADGWPLVAASRWFGKPLPERVAGSDLVPDLFEASTRLRHPLRVFLLGAMPGVGERAAKRIRAQWPNVEIVGIYSPPKGFEDNTEEDARILDQIRRVQPEILIVGLGAPRQEIWIAQHSPDLACSVAIAAGATIDFLAGEQKRAPRLWQRLGCEWLYRLLQDPRRLAKRYIADALAVPGLLATQWLEQRRPTS